MDRSGLISHPRGFGSLPAPKANWLCNFAASCFAYQTAPQAADCRRSRPAATQVIIIVIHPAIRLSTSLQSRTTVLPQALYVVVVLTVRLSFCGVAPQDLAAALDRGVFPASVERRDVSPVAAYRYPSIQASDPRSRSLRARVTAT